MAEVGEGLSIREGLPGSDQLYQRSLEATVSQVLSMPEIPIDPRSNKARQKLLKTVLVDRMRNEPLSQQELGFETRYARENVNRLLDGANGGMVGSLENDCLVLQQTGKLWTIAHFRQGQLWTMAAIDLNEASTQPSRVVFNHTHEGRVESFDVPGYELTRTAVHTLNLLVGRVGLTPSIKAVPENLLTQLANEAEASSKLIIPEEVYKRLSVEYGRLFDEGGVLLINDHSVVNTLGNLLTREGLIKFHHLIASETDDTLLALLIRGSQKLRSRVKALGQTSRGDASLYAAQQAANIGGGDRLPLIPGYNPYLDVSIAYPESPLICALLELAQAAQEGKQAMIIEGGPPTDRVYGTLIKLAKEQGLDVSQIPIMLMVAAEGEGAEATISPDPFNYNLSLGDDCKRGLNTILEHFNSVTLFSPEAAAGVGIPVEDFKGFLEFMLEQDRPDNEMTLARKFLDRAKQFSHLVPIFELLAKQKLGHLVGMSKNAFAIQDIAMGAFLEHPEWFEISEVKLHYNDQQGVERVKERMRLVKRMTDEGKTQFGSWFWAAIKANFTSAQR